MSDHIQSIEQQAFREFAALYLRLKAKYGGRADPEVWWPVYRPRVDPPWYERTIGNRLTTQAGYGVVERVIAALDDAGYTTASGLAGADVAHVAALIRPVG